jgi:hypothetical protein
MSLRSSDRGGSARAVGADMQPGLGTELQGPGGNLVEF